MNGKKIYLGILLMIVSAVCTCSGQLLWKLASTESQQIAYYMVGLILYGCGAMLMIVAFKFGEMSILHPMLSIGFVMALILGNRFLDEPITKKSLIGVALIICGILFLSQSEKGEKV